MIFSWGKRDEWHLPSEIDYSGYSDEEILDFFKSENWNVLDDKHRVAIIQEMENRNASEQGRSPATVVSLDSDDCYGQYNNLSNKLEVDVTNVSSYEVLDTYVHESNHAYQYYCINNKGKFNEETIDMIQAELARDENGNLYNYARSSPAYDIQCNELDSNNAAAEFMLAQRERYQNDSEYREYINERANHFANVNDSLIKNKEQRVAMQTDQTNIAYIRGDISEKQYSEIVDKLSDPNYEDPAAARSKELGGEFNELNKEYANESGVQNNTESEGYMGTVIDLAISETEAYNFEYDGTDRASTFSSEENDKSEGMT